MAITYIPERIQFVNGGRVKRCGRSFVRTMAAGNVLKAAPTDEAGTSPLPQRRGLSGVVHVCMSIFRLPIHQHIVCVPLRLNYV